MSIVLIDSIDDLRVASYREVADPELVRRQGLFVAEGRRVVERVIADGRCAIRSVLVSEAARRSLQPVLERLAGSVPIYVCRADGFLGLTGHNIHRGCLALAERPAPTRLDDVLRGTRLVLALEAISNADNVGGAFRNAAAFGADAILLSPTCCDPLYRKAIRTSMAATLRVPFARAEDWGAALERLRESGFEIVALTPRRPGEDLDRFAARRKSAKLAIVAGAEGTGLGAETEAAADVRVRIPILAEVDSLNVAVAIGIALHTVSRSFG